MAEGTAVVLLFDDTDLGALLREVLQERGARIVHEGAPVELDRDLLARVGADVVVINLGDDIDEVMDRLDVAIEGDRPRVVFNEAESCRSLDGWARARWARHLAAKVLASEDVDPPRPAEAAYVFAAESQDQALADEIDVPVATDPAGSGSEPNAHAAEVAAESESLEAELEALLSGEPLPGDAPDEDRDADVAAPAGARLEGADELDDFELDELLLDSRDHPPLYDGNFTDGASAGAAPPDRAASVAGGADDDLLEDVLRLADEDDDAPLAQPPAPPAGGAEALFQRTDSWALLDDDELVVPAPAPARPSAAEFGIEKVSALDYLAPESGPDAPSAEPIMTLELVSMEEAVAPGPYEPAAGAEMMLEELSGGLSRVVVLGATFASRDSVRAFLSALPAGMRAAIFLVQHQGDRAVEELVETLSRDCDLAVRAAVAGEMARVGELLVVPAEHQLRVTRDGRMELKAAAGTPSATPSIDATFSAMAGVFGVDALAIVFAGQANDAVAGCQAVHDRGGRIWVEDAPGEHFADMVSGVMAEHLADFSGTPAELAARLIEEY